MKFEELSRQIDIQGQVSRRAFTKSTVALAIAYAAMRPAKDLLAQPNRRKTLAYVGTDTSPVDGTLRPCAATRRNSARRFRRSGVGATARRQADRRLRPLARRFANTARPPTVDMRERNP